MNRTSHQALLPVAALAVLTLSACGQRSDDQTVGQKLDSAVDRTAQAAHEAKKDARESVASAAATARDKAKEAASTTREDTSDAASDARTAVMGAASGTRDKAASKADDTRISSSVKAGLAAEKEVSAARIDVDTQDGVVTLSGAVPTAAAKARANEVARQVKDVRSVNNQLTVAAS